jgi:hypothetical protein
LRLKPKNIIMTSNGQDIWGTVDEEQPPTQVGNKRTREGRPSEAQREASLSTEVSHVSATPPTASRINAEMQEGTANSADETGQTMQVMRLELNTQLQLQGLLLRRMEEQSGRMETQLRGVVRASETWTEVADQLRELVHVLRSREMVRVLTLAVQARAEQEAANARVEKENVKAREEAQIESDSESVMELDATTQDVMEMEPTLVVDGDNFKA